MGRKSRVDRSPEEKWQILQEGIKSGNVSEACRRRGRVGLTRPRIRPLRGFNRLVIPANESSI